MYSIRTVKSDEKTISARIDDVEMTKIDLQNG